MFCHPFGRGKFGTCTPLTLATLRSKVHTLKWAVLMLERKCIEIRKRHYLQYLYAWLAAGMKKMVVVTSMSLQILALYHRPNIPTVVC